METKNPVEAHSSSASEPRCPNPDCGSDKLWIFWHENRIGCDSCRSSYYCLHMADFAQFFPASQQVPCTGNPPYWTKKDHDWHLWPDNTHHCHACGAIRETSWEIRAKSAEAKLAASQQVDVRELAREVLTQVLGGNEMVIEQEVDAVAAILQKAMGAATPVLTVERDKYPWEVVPGEEDDDWGIRRVGEHMGSSVAQMLWERDAKEIVALHNSAGQAEEQAWDALALIASAPDGTDFRKIAMDVISGTERGAATAQPTSQEEGQ